MAPAPFAPSVSLAEALLAPTRIYTDAVKAALAAGRVTSVSHITGGGLIENPPRVYSDGLAMHLDMTRRPAPALFSWLKREAGLSVFELARTFNCGIGLLITTPAEACADVLAAIDATGEPCWEIGEVRTRGMRLSIWRMQSRPFMNPADRPLKIAVLISGRGSNMQALAAQVRDSRLFWWPLTSLQMGWISQRRQG